MSQCKCRQPGKGYLRYLIHLGNPFSSLSLLNLLFIGAKSCVVSALPCIQHKPFASPLIPLELPSLGSHHALLSPLKSTWFCLLQKIDHLPCIPLIAFAFWTKAWLHCGLCPFLINHHQSPFPYLADCQIWKLTSKQILLFWVVEFMGHFRPVFLLVL